MQKQSNTKSRQVMIRLDEETEKKAKTLIQYFYDEYGLSITFTDLVKMCIVQELRTKTKKDDFA